jgi:YVTN family beta-propeller protein
MRPRSPRTRPLALPGGALLGLGFLLGTLAAPGTRAAPSDPKAVALAQRSMDAMGGKAAFEARPFVRFDWAVERDGNIGVRFEHRWDRATGRYRLDGKTKEGKAFRVLFNVNDRQGRAWLDGKLLEGKEASDYLEMAYGRFINDSYWLLMPWKWLDPGVTLADGGAKELGGQAFEVAILTFEKGTGMTSADRYWGFISKQSGRMERWEYLLEKEDGSPGDGAPTAWTWSDWKDAGGGVRLATRMTKEGEGPRVAIVFPVAALEAEVPAGAFDPPAAGAPAAATATPPGAGAAAAPAAGSPAAAGVKEAIVVVHSADQTATLIETQFLEVVGNAPTGLGPREAVVANGRILFVTNEGTPDKPGNTLTVIDVPTAKVLRTVDLGANKQPHGMALAADGSLFVTTEATKSLLKLAAKDQSIEKVYRTDQDGTHMVVLSPDGKRAYTSNRGSGSITAIDLANGKVTSVPAGNGAEGIDVTPDGKELWVAMRGEEKVKVFDAATLALLATVPSGKMPVRVKVTPDGKWVLVACNESNDLRLYDRALRTPAGTIALGAAPEGLLIAPGDEIAFVTLPKADQVALVDIVRKELLGSVSAGKEPQGLAWARW